MAGEAGKNSKAGSSRHKHHARPGSRGGTRDSANLFVFPGDKQKRNAPKHVAWHVVFSNRTNPEALAKLALWEKRDETLNRIFFHKPTLHSWGTVFGLKAEPKDVVAFIWTFYGESCVLRDLESQLCGRRIDQLVLAFQSNLTPRSGGGKRKKKKRYAPPASWGQLFGNRSAVEALIDLAFWECADGSLNKSLMRKDMIISWNRLFGVRTTPRQAARCIWIRFGEDLVRKDLVKYLDGRNANQLMEKIVQNLTSPDGR